jgi:Mor family transcriptional regulator
MKELKDRNLIIVNDKKTMSWSGLVKKYGMAQSTLQRIVKRTNEKYGLKVENNE